MEEGDGRLDDEIRKIKKLFSAIKKDDMQEVEGLLKAGVSLDIVYKNNTPLHYAVKKNKKEIVEQLLQKWKVDINARNNKYETPLHIAVSKGDIELVRLLLNKNADVNIENGDGKTPIHVAKCSTYPNKDEMIEVLEKYSTFYKLKKFVEDYVYIFENNALGYGKRLANGEPKIGKLGSLVNEAPPTMSTKFFQSGFSATGVKHNREKLKEVISLLHEFVIDPDKFRQELVKCGVEVFYNFESQFVQVTGDGSWRRGIKKLAEDAVDRVIDYYRKNPEIEVSASSFNKGIIFGKSTTYQNTSTSVPNFKLGHTVNEIDSKSWSTAELFDTTGFVTTKADGTTDKYYKKKYESSNTTKYGYRLLFDWEKIDESYEEEMPCKGEYKYVLKPSEKWNSVKNILETINKHEENHQNKKSYMFDIRKSVTSFTGREKQLNEIANHIEHKIVVINGLGGVGKSELAIKYAYKDYVDVIWINAETHATAKDSFLRLLKELEIETKDIDKDEKSVRLMANEVYDFFAGRKSLFILDNAKEHSIIKEFLPLRTDGYHVLITSQNRQLFNEQEHGNVAKLRLDVLSEDKAVEFVKKTLNINNALQDKDIRELIEIFGCLPLALQLAVAYIKKSGYVETIRKCVEIYKKSQKEFEAFLDQKGLESYDKSIFLTFKNTIDKVKQGQDGKLAEEILNTAAYFAPANIAIDIFLKIAQDSVDECDVRIKCERANGMLMRAINLLSQYSILTLKEKQVDIHRQIQGVVKFELNKQDENGKVQENEVLEKALLLLREYPGDAADCIPHIISIWEYASKYDELIKSFIVDSSNNKATTSRSYFSLIIEGSNFEVIDSIIKGIDHDYIKEVVNAKNKDDATPLHTAVLRNDAKVVNILVNVGADIYAEGREKWTPLHFAMKNGNLEVVNILIDNGAEVNKEAIYGLTPLHLAAEFGYKEVVEALLEKGANINAQTQIGFTPLHLAAAYGRFDVVEALLRNSQIFINAEIDDKNTPLHLAAQEGYSSIVEALLANGAIINSQTGDGCTPLHMAAANGHFDVVQTLLKNSQIFINAENNDKYTALHLAAGRGYSSVVEALLAKDAINKGQAGDGFTPLHLAAVNGHFDVVEALLRNSQIFINAETDDKNTPLHFAAIGGYSSIVEALLAKGAIINAEAGDGFTPLHLAAANGHFDVVQTLLKNSQIFINAETDDKYTALHYAAHGGYSSVVEALLAKGAIINSKAGDGSTPLHLAVADGHFDVVQTLLKNSQIFINAKTDDKYTALHLAAEEGYSSIVEALLAKDAIINGQIEFGFTPLHLAVGKGHFDVVQALLRSTHIFVNAETEKKYTPLHFAAKWGHLRIVEALLAKNADVNIQSKDGSTPLHLAVLKSHDEVGNLKIVKALIAKNADVNIKNGDGNTASDLGHVDVRDYLSSIINEQKRLV